MLSSLKKAKSKFGRKDKEYDDEAADQPKPNSALFFDDSAFHDSIHELGGGMIWSEHANSMHADHLKDDDDDEDDIDEFGEDTVGDTSKLRKKGSIRSSFGSNLVRKASLKKRSPETPVLPDITEDITEEQTRQSKSSDRRKKRDSSLKNDIIANVDDRAKAIERKRERKSKTRKNSPKRSLKQKKSNSSDSRKLIKPEGSKQKTKKDKSRKSQTESIQIYENDVAIYDVDDNVLPSMHLSPTHGHPAKSQLDKFGELWASSRSLKSSIGEVAFAVKGLDDYDDGNDTLKTGSESEKELRKKVANLENELLLARQETKSLTTQKVYLNEEVELLDKQSTNLQRDLEDEIEKNDVLRKKVAELEKRLQQQGDERESERREENQSRFELESMVDTFKTEADNFEEELKKQDTIILDLEDEIGSLKKEKEQQKESTSEREQIARSLNKAERDLPRVAMTQRSPAYFRQSDQLKSRALR